MTRTHRLLLSTIAVLGLAGCDSEIASTFKSHSDAMCGCSDADCARGEHEKFMASWEEMKNSKIDWTTDEGKKDTKKIEAAVKSYRGCLDKQVTAKAATEFCQADDEGKQSSESCTACCVGQGRFFNSWVDPLAAGLASAFGGGDIKGCTCN